MMDRTLHITNGDGARGVMEAAQVPGKLLAWKDVLHEGPVPGGIPLEELTAIRAQFISDCGWDSRLGALRILEQRNKVLQEFREYDELVLWFEHDLYDQLQLLQILDWLSEQEIDDFPIKLALSDDYLGRQSIESLRAIWNDRRPVTREQIHLARVAWTAFRDSSPIQWRGMLERDTSAFPHLRAAVFRHLEQFPSAANGLNRTEYQVLEAVQSGASNPAEIFAYNQQADEIEFMGLNALWNYLAPLVHNEPALLATPNADRFNFPDNVRDTDSPDSFEVRITPVGDKVIGCEQDWLDINPLDRWLGGVHLHPGNTWRWYPEAEAIAKTDN